MLLVNTLAISILNLVFYFPAPIVLALLLNEMKSQFFKRTAQTLVYIPHFISFVIVATLTFQLFNIQDGIVNQIIQKITGIPSIFWADRNISAVSSWVRAYGKKPDTARSYSWQALVRRGYSAV